MSNFIARLNSFPTDARQHLRYSLVQRGLLAVALCSLNGTILLAQTRSLPSHGTTRLDSYNRLLRDVHPASQAQSNYLQNRLILTGLKKAERLERHERLDVHGEKQLIKKLQNYDRVTKGISAGRSTSAVSLASFWVLLSTFGDRSEVYDALSLPIPPVPHDQFLPTTSFIQVVQPNGELVHPPLLLEGAARLDASAFQSAWKTVVNNLRVNASLSARDVATFHNSVAAYRKLGKVAITNHVASSGRSQAERYLVSLGSLSDALYRPQQCAQIREYVEAGGYVYRGGNMLGLVQHMMRNRVLPAQGSTAQIALAELARPISRVLEHEIAVHYERIDSLAAGEGHRPYTAEYRGNGQAQPDKASRTQVSQLSTAINAGT